MEGDGPWVLGELGRRGQIRSLREQQEGPAVGQGEGGFKGSSKVSGLSNPRNLELIPEAGGNHRKRLRLGWGWGLGQMPKSPRWQPAPEAQAERQEMGKILGPAQSSNTLWVPGQEKNALWASRSPSYKKAVRNKRLPKASQSQGIFDSKILCLKCPWGQ